MASADLQASSPSKSEVAIAARNPDKPVLPSLLQSHGVKR